MRHVLSLISADAKSLGRNDVELVRRALSGVSVWLGDTTWLSPGEACEFPFDGDAEAVRAAARFLLQERPLDVNVVPQDFRRKKLLIADMDSTMIRQECIDELAAEVGLRDKVAGITERAMRGEIAFAPALRERVALLKGLSSAVVEKVLSQRIELMPGARVLISTMHAHGAHTALVSGGFGAFVEPVGRAIGFLETRANTLVSDAGVFTGMVAEPILGAEAKEETLVELTSRLGLSRDETLAVGDGANDAAMLRRAGLGVGFRPKPALRAVADATLDHADLRGLLYLQGYRQEELMEPA